MSLNTRVAAIFGAASLMLAGALATQHEGTRYVAYQDVGGIWTICEGDTHNVKRGDTATRQECDERLQKNLIAASQAFDRCGSPNVSVFERAAYQDFIFNAGEGNFCSSTMAKKLRSGDRKGACSEFDRWMRADGKDCRIAANNCMGIVKRRQDERELCMLGLN